MKQKQADKQNFEVLKDTTLNSLHSLIKERDGLTEEMAGDTGGKKLSYEDVKEAFHTAMDYLIDSTPDDIHIEDEIEETLYRKFYNVLAREYIEEDELVPDKTLTVEQIGEVFEKSFRKNPDYHWDDKKTNGMAWQKKV